MKNKTRILFLLILVQFGIQSCLSEDDASVIIPPLNGIVVAPDIGGPSQPNQVWIDLSTGNQQINQRPDWDLGFYSGDEFRVILNYSIMMAAGSINSTNIDAVTESDFQSLRSQISSAAGLSPEFIDDVTGNYLNNGTAINEISANDAENKVYLVKLGYKTFNGEIPPYSTNVTGDSRGYKKVRILRNDANSYKILYADLNDTSHQEMIIQKDSDFHFSFFSFNSESVVSIQPQKQDWDLGFTVFNNVIPILGTYIFSDFVISNTMSNVASYEIIGNPLTIEDQFNGFSISDVNPSLWVENDQTSIGGNWRETVSGTTSTPVVNSDRFYVIRDANGAFYKLRFISMLNESNERGYPLFEYQAL